MTNVTAKSGASRPCGPPRYGTARGDRAERRTRSRSSKPWLRERAQSSQRVFSRRACSRKSWLSGTVFYYPRLHVYTLGGGKFVISGNLFTRDYLLDGIERTDQWKSLKEKDFLALKQRLQALAEKFLKIAKPNEAETKKEFIYPVIEALGWLSKGPQAAGRNDHQRSRQFAARCQLT
jgi:hypothetical protein